MCENPAEYAHRCDLPLNHEFKKKLTLGSLNNWWKEKTVSSSSGALFSKGRKKQSSSRQLLQELGERPDEGRSTQPESPPQSRTPTYPELKARSRLQRQQAEQTPVTVTQKGKADISGKSKAKNLPKPKKVLPPESDSESEEEPSPPPAKKKRPSVSKNYHYPETTDTICCTRQDNSRQPTRPHRCFNCGKPGHLQRQCREPRRRIKRAQNHKPPTFVFKAPITNLHIHK